MSKLLQPFIPDETRGKRSDCQICHKKFHILNRVEHKCKRCFRSVCVNCAPERAKTYKQDGTIKDHRVCKKCAAENRLISKYYQDYKLSFGQDSQFSTVWIKRIFKQKKLFSQIIAEYTGLQSSSNQAIQKFKRQSTIIFEQLYKSYNYSFRHFVELVKGSTDTNSMHQAIQNVMIAILGKVEGLNYFPEMIYLVVFFLSFSSQYYAYMLLVGVFQKMFPQYCKILKPKRDNILSKQIKSILSMVQELVEPSQKSVMPELKQYLDSQAIRMLNTLTINFCNFQVTFHIIHESMQKGSFQQLYKGIASLVYLSKDVIASRVPYDQVQRFIVKNITLQKIKAQMCRLQKINVQSKQEQDVKNNPQFHKKSNIYNVNIHLEQQLSRRTAELNQFNQRWLECTKQLDEQKRKNDQLKQQMCVLGVRIDELQNYQQLKRKYTESIQIIRQLQNSNRHLKNQINIIAANEEIAKKKIQEYEFLHVGNQDELIKLQTENEVLRLKVESKQINIQTDHFERQIIDKNRRIMDLQSKLSSSQIRIKYLQKSSSQMELELSSKPIISLQNKECLSENGYQAKQFKEQINMSISIVNRQKERIEELQTENSKYELLVFELTNKTQNQLNQLKILKQKLEQMIKLQQKPKQGQNAIAELLQQQINRQQNLIRKNNLQKVWSKIKEYQHQLKIKALDLRLKGNRIEQLISLNIQNDIKDISPLIMCILNNQKLISNPPQQKQKEDCILF